MSDNILPLVAIGIGGLALLAFSLNAENIGSATTEVIEGTGKTVVDTGVGLVQGGVNIVSGRGQSTTEQYQQREGTIKLGESCTQNSDCSQLMTRPGPGGDIGSRVGCVIGKCDVRQVDLLNLGIYSNPIPGSRIPDDAIEALKQNNTYIGDYRTVSVGKACVDSNACSGTGIAGDAPNPTEYGCCQGTCEKLQTDFLGVKACKKDCVGSLFGRPGTCNDQPSGGSNQSSVVSGGTRPTTTEDVSKADRPVGGLSLGIVPIY